MNIIKRFIKRRRQRIIVEYLLDKVKGLQDKIDDGNTISDSGFDCKDFYQRLIRLLYLWIATV